MELMQNPLFVKLYRDNWAGFHVFITIKDASADGIPEKDIKKKCHLTQKEYEDILELLLEETLIQRTERGFYKISQTGLTFIEMVKGGYF